MSDDESFLARWSRRKRTADARRAEDEATNAEPQNPKAQATPDSAERNEAVDPADEPEAFDLSKLPPLESITAATDIRAFLAPGVPAELARAALRRAWSADPAIRDFVGIAENQWDFATPGATPGFGPLEATEDIRRLVERIVGPSAAQDGAPEQTPHADGAPEPQQLSGDLRPAAPEFLPAPIIDSASTDETAEVVHLSEIEDRRHDVAMQNEMAVPKARKGGQGGALPQ